MEALCQFAHQCERQGCQVSHTSLVCQPLAALPRPPVDRNLTRLAGLWPGVLSWPPETIIVHGTSERQRQLLRAGDSQGVSLRVSENELKGD